MKIQISPHAKKRMYERNITQEQIREVVENPHTTYPDKDFKNRTIARRKVGNRSLRVVYKSMKTGIIVISTMWETGE